MCVLVWFSATYISRGLLSLCMAAGMQPAQAATEAGHGHPDATQLPLAVTAGVTMAVAVRGGHKHHLPSLMSAAAQRVAEPGLSEAAGEGHCPYFLLTQLSQMPHLAEQQGNMLRAAGSPAVHSKVLQWKSNERFRIQSLKADFESQSRGTLHRPLGISSTRKNKGQLSLGLDKGERERENQGGPLPWQALGEEGEARGCPVREGAVPTSLPWPTYSM